MSILGILLHNFFILLADTPPKNTKKTQEKTRTIPAELSGLKRDRMSRRRVCHESRKLKQARRKAGVVDLLRRNTRLLLPHRTFAKS